MTEKCCGTCRHSSVSCEERDCAKRPGWGAWEGGLCEDWVESNWQRYFGTPEKAAKTLISVTWHCADAMENNDSCRKCLLHGRCFNTESLVKWLETDAL